MTFGNCASSRLNGLDAAMLARRQRTPGFVGVGLEAPEAQGLRIKKIKDVPGKLLLVNEWDESLAVNGVKRLNVQGRQFVAGVRGVGLGAAGFGVGFLHLDKVAPAGTAGAFVDAAHPLTARQSLQSIFAERTQDGSQVGDCGLGLGEGPNLYGSLAFLGPFGIALHGGILLPYG
jgi:hypothetical protein